MKKMEYYICSYEGHIDGEAQFCLIEGVNKDFLDERWKIYCPIKREDLREHYENAVKEYKKRYREDCIQEKGIKILFDILKSELENIRLMSPIKNHEKKRNISYFNSKCIPRRQYRPRFRLNTNP